MGAPSAGEPAGNDKVSIGVWSAKQNRFVPCLTVDDRCIVTVHGNLHVEGLLEAALMPGQFSVSPEARASAAGMMMMSLSHALSTKAAARVDLEREIRSAAAGIEPIATEAAVAPAPTDIQPKLDDAIKDVIKVLSENSLLPRFVTLLRQETNINISELAAAGPVPETHPTEPERTTPPEEHEPTKAKSRTRRKKSG
jgi:hypothetical protein